MSPKAQSHKLEIIKRYAAGTRQCLKKAFWRRSPGICENLKALGKSVGPRTLRMMTEETDVTRRNTLENTLLVLGATYLEAPKEFDRLWTYLESFNRDLRGGAPKFGTLERTLTEFRYKVVTAERHWCDGNEEQFEAALVEVDETLKGIRSHLVLKDQFGTGSR